MRPTRWRCARVPARLGDHGSPIAGRSASRSPRSTGAAPRTRSRVLDCGWRINEARPEWLAGIVLGTVVQFEATEEGTYSLEHIVDDNSKRLPIHVVIGVP